MSEADTVDTLISSLQRMAAERPRDARALVERLLDDQPPELSTFLARIGAPGESRLRHLVAHAVRLKPNRGQKVPHLGKWLATETDEFTKNALRGALDIIATESTVEISKPKPREFQPAGPQFIQAYRYAASRLTHRIRNSLPDPQRVLLKLKHEISDVPDPGLQAKLHKLLADLEGGFQRVSRVAEYDVDDGHFEMRSLVIIDWIRQMNMEYAHKFSPVNLTIESQLPASLVARIIASDYLLYTIFWNLWMNAQQASPHPCRITVQASLDNSMVRLTLSDNGEGFSSEARDMMFTGTFSSKGKNRGRGLLEVQDAIERLHGDVRLIYECDEYRLCLRFPLEGA